MNIPAREECLEILNEYKVPENVINHCIMVNKIAVFLAKKLKEKGIDVNIELVDAASLLHDVGRTGEKEQYPNPVHLERGYERLKEKYPAVADTIRVHGLLLLDRAKTWEQKIANYADKRAWEHEVVSLQKRISSIERRYEFTFPEEQKQKYSELEKEIFDIIELEPDKLGEYID